MMRIVVISMLLITHALVCVFDHARRNSVMHVSAVME